MISIKKLYSIFQKHPLVITDSRKIQPGCLFFALKGEHFDGNQFAAEALKMGAAFAVIDDPTAGSGRRFLPVKNVLESLQKLALHHRRQFDCPVIGITGSNGKTTTKELVSAVLGSHYRTHFTAGNLNNHIGVPLTLLSMPLETEVAVIEMGANHVGEIDFLCRLVEPTHGLITNIGKAHLEGFGGLAGVKRAKSELFRWLIRKNGLIFLNLDEKFLPALARRARKKIEFMCSGQPDPSRIPLETKLISEKPFLKIGFLDGSQILEIQTQLVGRYNFSNLMTAVALGRYFKVPSDKIRAAIEGYLPSNMRSQLVERQSNTFLLDAYNANPTSMKNALENFSKMTARRKIAILGDMRELGPDSRTEHLQILKQAKKLKRVELILVGPEFGQVADAETRHFQDAAALKSWFDGQVFSKTLFLLKGSRGVRLETILG